MEFIIKREFSNIPIVHPQDIRLLYNEMKITMVSCFFALIHQKSGPKSSFFSWISTGTDHFLHNFCKNKISHFFRQKYHTTVTTHFEKAGSQKIRFFWTPFFAVYGSLLADNIGGFWPKKSEDIWTDILFFVCDIHFFF